MDGRRYEQSTLALKTGYMRKDCEQRAVGGTVEIEVRRVGSGGWCVTKELKTNFITSHSPGPEQSPLRSPSRKA